MDLSIIIVSYNTREKLQKCLQSVFASRTNYTFEVRVVDNASSDGSAEITKKDFPQAKLIENKENLGYAKANNIAIREILGEGEGSKYILLLNSDVEVSPDTFDKMLKFMDNDSTVGIAGCKVVKPDGKLDPACRRSFPDPTNALYRLSGLSLLFSKSERFAKYNLSYLPENETLAVDSVMGAFLLARRSVVQEIGLLDEDFFMYGEDLDWCWRAKAAGFKVTYVPVTTVVHDKGSSSRKSAGKALFEFHRAMALFYDKHYRNKYNFIIHGLVKIGIWSRYLIKLLENAIRKAKYVSK